MKTKLINWIKKYTKESNSKGYVINISGGKDSTVVAGLLVAAVGADKVLGILQPNGKQKDISDSIRVCKFLDIDYMEVNISDINTSIIKNTQALTKSKKLIQLDSKTQTNIPPRVRMTVARAIAQSIGYRFAGTGNLSERYIGWFTKDGDSACDLNVIAGLTCSQVVKVGDELGLPSDLVHKVPEDGLTGKSDEENFGFTYKQLDDFLLEGTSGDANIDNTIKHMHLKSLHKNGAYTPSMSIVDSSFNANDEVYEVVPWFDEEVDNEEMRPPSLEPYSILSDDLEFSTTYVSKLSI